MPCLFSHADGYPETPCGAVEIIDGSENARRHLLSFAAYEELEDVLSVEEEELEDEVDEEEQELILSSIACAPF